MTVITMTNPICFKFIQAIFMMCLFLQLQVDRVFAEDEVRCIEKERQALLHFKAGLVDEYGILSSWGSEEDKRDCCQWKGIGCSNQSGHIQILDLHGESYDYSVPYLYSGPQFLRGKIHKSLMELQQLKYLNLSLNDFRGNSHIPEFFGSMSNLRYLDLSSCFFVGKLPSQLGPLSNLKYLNLSWNSLEGSIPYQLGNFSKLQHLDLRGNYLEGAIPSQLGNISSLQKLYLGYNGALKIDDGNHAGGQWLSHLTSLTHLDLSHVLNLNISHSWLQMTGKLSKLSELSLSGCGFSDHFILSLTPYKFNISTSLSIFDLSENAFASPMIFQWVPYVSSNLVELDLSGNFMEASTSNDFGTTMSSLDLSHALNHNDSHSLLHSIGKLPKLRELRLSNCNLSDDFLLSLTPFKLNFSSSLSIFDLSRNAFASPMIFQWVSNFSSNLVELDLSVNLLMGSPSNYFGTSMISLKQLDLSDNRFKGDDLRFISNICTLHSLHVRNNNLTEDLLSVLHNLSIGCIRYSLQELDMSFNQITGSLPDLSIFSSLRTLDISINWLSGEITEGSKLPPQLESLSIRSNFLEGGIPKSFGNACTLSSLELFNNSLNEELSRIIHHLSGCARYTLQELNLAGNQINGTLPDLSMFSTLKTLDLSENRLNGKIPEESKLSSQLEYLSISSNFLEGGIPKSFGDTCTLGSLDLSNNSLSDELPQIILRLSGCARYSLQSLHLGMNKINGSLPDLSIFPSLKSLYLHENGLNGKILENYRFPPQLETLDMSSNSLKGVLVDSHFANVSKLKTLDLSDNSLAMAFTQNWVPPFQLHHVGLRSCNLGPVFPKWLQTQNNLQDLDISNCGISDIVPKWFWAKLGLQRGMSINISYNNFEGIIPNLPLRNAHHFLTLASNQFEGPIPPFLRGVISLDLSKNKFSGSLLFLCADGPVETLGQLDLSNNQLSGQIPNCWSHFKSLAYLDLSHNNFLGKIPTSMGSLLELQALLLRNNSLSKGISLSLRSCTKLVMLDVGENRLSGRVPSWIGSRLQELQMLSLRRNNLSGSLPPHLCFLKSIQVLDLSLNNLSGQIPKCFKNFSSMAQKSSSRDFSDHTYIVNVSSGPRYGGSYYLNAILMWKGAEQMFMNNQLLLLKSIDLSSNQLSEEIPTEIENLFELVSLNLSRNNLTGEIPLKIGRLTWLEFLDLSRNQLVGSIPSSLNQIDRLTMLDLSHNHLSGEIPTGTQLQSFNASSYEDNLDLCGRPLQKMCKQEKSSQEPMVKFREDEDSVFTHAFHMSMPFGFATGFWGIFGSILVKRSWRHAYFRFMNNLTDSIYVMIAVRVAKYKRWLKG